MFVANLSPIQKASTNEKNYSADRFYITKIIVCLLLNSIVFT